VLGEIGGPFDRNPEGGRQELERQEAVLVRRARNEGIVWEQIAACLGVSRQAVHKKHAGGLRRRTG